MNSIDFAGRLLKRGKRCPKRDHVGKLHDQDRKGSKRRRITKHHQVRVVQDPEVGGCAELDKLGLLPKLLKVHALAPKSFRWRGTLAK